MNIPLSASFSLFFGLTLPFSLASQPDDMPGLIPLPSSIQLQDGMVEFRDLGPLAAWARQSPDAPIRSKEDWKQLGDSPTRVELAPLPVASLGGDPEAYKITVSPELIRIEAHSRLGVLRAAATLKQLLDDNSMIPQGTIEDRPRFRYRGFMLDSARHMQSPDTIRKLLDQMADLKFNRFHWHLTDDEGWRIPISAYPRLTQIGGTPDPGNREQERNGSYSEEEIMDIVQYARARGIEIIPEIDVPGHAAAISAAYPQLLCPTNRDNPPISQRSNSLSHTEVLCIGNPGLLDFLETIYLETSKLFDTKTIHIGGDEVKTQFWKKCPLCSAALRQSGLNSMEELQLAFLRQLSERLAKHGIQTITWAEHPEKGLTPDIIAQGWRGHPNQTIAALNAGIKTICSDGGGKGYAYLDFPGYPKTAKPLWMPVLSLEQVYAYDIPINQVEESKHNLLQGGEAALWTENILSRDIEAQIYPRLHAVAEKLWTPRERQNAEQFMQRLGKLRKRWEDSGIAFEQPPNPSAAMVLPATIDTNIPATRNFQPPYAFDGRETTSFISSRHIQEGDYFTLILNAPERLSRVRVLTGPYFCRDAGKENALADGALLQISTDGTTFTDAATFRDGIATVQWPQGQTVKSIRILTKKSQPHKLAIGDIFVEPFVAQESAPDGK